MIAVHVSVDIKVDVNKLLLDATSRNDTINVTALTAILDGIAGILAAVDGRQPSDAEPPQSGGGK